MTIELNTWGVPLRTGFTAWFTPQQDITPYELSLALILISGKRTLEDLQRTYDQIIEVCPLAIRHFKIKESNA